ncbi:MAG: DUF1015 domain-containing protein [Clostridiales bacterium]|jgi:hypothetical protein|nr:DUF1015 domain-containing protein [Clostridiales bacterium]
MPKALLPAPGVDPEKWSVIACDQYTSSRSYWQGVSDFVGRAHSALRLILPELYLNDGYGERVRAIHEAMREYCRQGALRAAPEGFILTARTLSGGAVRHGLIAVIDLERYEYAKGSRSLVRATEATVADRLPPRIKIRRGSLLELPHILILFDDPGNALLGPLVAAAEPSGAGHGGSEYGGVGNGGSGYGGVGNGGSGYGGPTAPGLEKLYDFELMAGGGHLRGYLANSEAHAAHIAETLGRLAIRREAGAQSAAGGGSGDSGAASNMRATGGSGAAGGMRAECESCGGPGAADRLLFAVGDGNHSLAAAKAHWEELKKTLPAEAAQGHPARYAMAELVNIHSDAIKFEPIHRALFGADPKAALGGLCGYLAQKGYGIRIEPHLGAGAEVAPDSDAAQALPGDSDGCGREASGDGNAQGARANGFSIPMMWPGHSALAHIDCPAPALPVAVLQAFLDDFCAACPGASADYIHGEDELARLVRDEGCLAFILPAIDKRSFFDTIARDGQFPKKAFSMGVAADKRYYFEARAIQPDA